MSEKAFDDVIERLREVNAIIEKLAPEIRRDAFEILRPYVEGSPYSTTTEESVEQPAKPPAGGTDLEALIRDREIKTPAEAVFALTAYLFSQYGSAPFSVDDIRALADETGLTVPQRTDMTLTQAKREGKALFRRAGRGLFAPTVQGELVLREDYGVQKGRKKRPTDDS